MESQPQTAQLVVGHFPIDRRSDADLVRLVAQGNDAALAVVFQRYGHIVKRTLKGQLRDDAAVDDLTQEVFLGFHRTASNVSDPEKLRAYLVGTAFRQAKQYIRQNSRRRRLLSFFGQAQEGATRGSPTAHARDDLRFLREVLDRLPERLQDSFVLRYVEELGPQEIADARGVSLATAKRDIARARERVFYYAEREPALRGYLRHVPGASDTDSFDSSNDERTTDRTRAPEASSVDAVPTAETARSRSDQPNSSGELK